MNQITSSVIPSTLPGAAAKHLFQFHQQELDALFDSLSCPADAQLQGLFRGTLFGISGINALPRWLRSPIYRLLASFINPWKGKSFADGEGANSWFNSKGAVSFGYYFTGSGDDEQGKPLLRLNYLHPRTPGLLQPIRGEARLLADGVWLARMRWQGKNNLTTLLYFTLEPAA